MEAIATAALIGSTAMQAFSMYQGGQTQQKIGEANAQIYQRESQTQADQLRTKVKRLMSSQTVGFSKAGVRMEGTPTAVGEETYTEGEKDAMAILSQGMSRANIARVQGNAAAQGGMWGAGGSILGGVGKYYQYKRGGISIID